MSDTACLCVTITTLLTGFLSFLNPLLHAYLSLLYSITNVTIRNHVTRFRGSYWLRQRCSGSWLVNGGGPHRVTVNKISRLPFTLEYLMCKVTMLLNHYREYSTNLKKKRTLVNFLLSKIGNVRRDVSCQITTVLLSDNLFESCRFEITEQ